MSAAAAARAPLSQEAGTYWQELVAHCQRHVNAINTVASQHGLPADHRLEWRVAPDLQIFNSHHPTTNVTLRINYCSWGPMIDGVITGFEQEDCEFCPEEFTVPVARDLDGSIVAIYEEGRSFSPQELAAFVMQSFRRCYPGLSLPCDES